MAEEHADLLTRLPHRPPMRLIDEIVSVGGTRVTCRSTIGTDHLLRRPTDGRVPAIVVIELFAQTAAALMMHRASLAGPGGRHDGLLVGVRTLDFEVDAFDVGDVLTTHLEERYTAGPVAQLAGTIERDDVVVARGAINVARS